MEELAERAAALGARWIMFHEGTLCDYTPRVAEMAESLPGGKSARRMARLAGRLGCHISFGLTEQSQSGRAGGNPDSSFEFTGIPQEGMIVTILGYEGG